MKIETAFDNLHEKVTSNFLLQSFTVFTRLILAIGFIPPSVKKILHQPFTILPDSNPVGHYFNALYETGFYYEFIGWAQLIAALLLLFPRTTHLGAMAFFPIILNIAVLTSSVGFAGTNYLTGLMLLASTYLVCWEYDRLKPLLFGKRERRADFSPKLFIFIPAFFAAGGAAVGVFFTSLGVANLHRHTAQAIAGLTIAGLVFGLVFTVYFKFMPVGEIKTGTQAAHLPRRGSVVSVSPEVQI